MSRIVADISIDLDNLWSYLKSHRDDTWKQYPSYLGKVVPLILDTLGQHALKATVFVVGRDAEIPDNREPLMRVAGAGHEIGNHSFEHEPWMGRYNRERLESEFDQAEQALGKITPQAPRGFRGPGYSLSEDILEILCQRNYAYDASTWPTFVGPLARTYHKLSTRRSQAPPVDQQQTFGTLRDGLRRVRPYRFKTCAGSIVEFPVTTMPWFRMPMHFSYLMYLASFSNLAAKAYFRSALMMCRLNKVGPSLLLHPTDFIGGDEVPEMSFFPGMTVPGARKRELVDAFLNAYTEQFDVCTMSERYRRLDDDKLVYRTFA